MLDPIDLILIGAGLFAFYLLNAADRLDAPKAKDMKSLEDRIKRLEKSSLTYSTDIQNLQKDVDRAYASVDQIQEKIAELEVSVQNIANRNYE